MGVSAGMVAGCKRKAVEPPPDLPVEPDPAPTVRKAYTGPNVVVIRFGGGIRRQETIEIPEQTCCPFIYHELYEKRGILFNNVEIAQAPGVETNHAQCTLYMTTGRYEKYEDIRHKPYEYRFEPHYPTVFEYLRREYDLPAHQALIVNCEDRFNDEYLHYSTHPHYGLKYRATVLSLYRLKKYQTERALHAGGLGDAERKAAEAELAQLYKKDYRQRGAGLETPETTQFWERWCSYYGNDRLVQPRGDRLLTALSLRALRELRPRLLLVNYCDPDFVHWGPRHLYKRGISIIDEGVRELWEACQADGGDGNGHTYRDNTIFLVMPDCGRDSNPCMPVPFQHHFGSKTSHEIFLIAAGPGVIRSTTPVDGLRQQTSLAATIGTIMKFPTRHAEASVFEEMLA